MKSTNLLFLVVALSVPLPTLAGVPCTIDFSTFQDGDWVGPVGCQTTVKTRKLDGGYLGPNGNQALVIDTEHPAPGNYGIGTPNQDFGGPGHGGGGKRGRPGENSEPRGNAVIVAKAEGMETGRMTNPTGGHIDFVFDELVKVTELGLLDSDDEDPVLIKLITEDDGVKII